jgi:hypothetical protein
MLVVACRSSAVDTDALVRSRWGPENEGDGYSVAFMADGTYSITYSGEGGVPKQAEGVFAVEGDAVGLVPKESAARSVFGRLTTFALRSDSASLYFEEKLVSDDVDVVFWNQSKPVSEGVERLFGGVPVVMEEKRAVVVSQNLNMRDKPSVQSNRLHLAQASTETITPYLPQGWRLRTVGRTRERVRVEGWTNYWYLVDVMTNAYEELLLEGDLRRPYRSDLVWVFGEFLDLEVDNKGG